MEDQDKPQNNIITLDQPIKRGDTEITSVEITRPNSGSLRGVGLRELLDMDVNALIKVLPRVTSPTVTEADIAEMDPADLVQAGAVVVGFLLNKETRRKAGV